MLIADCVKYNNHKYCKEFKTNLIVLLLCILCFILDSFFSILYDFDWGYLVAAAFNIVSFVVKLVKIC